jgi:hypothetical protein
MTRNGTASAWLDELFKRNDQTIETVAQSIRNSRNSDHGLARVSNQSTDAKKRA